MHDRRKSVVAGHLRPALSAGLACVLLAAATLAQAGKVTPPPLPPGSHLVRVQPGMDKLEQQRQIRAHHHKGHLRKNLARDDSVSGNDSNQSAQGNTK